MARDRNKGIFGVGLKSLLIRGAASLLILPSSGPTFAQAPAPPPAYEPAPNAAPEAQPPRFTQAELEHLLAPIALFPDALLAQLLPASAYPLEIVQAHRWLERNSAAAANGDFSGADAQNWDPSVKAMVRFPTVLQKLNDDLDWTRNLGDAIVNQPQEVADAIQRLRLKAQQAGALASNDQMTVVTQKEGPREVIVIQSPNPSVIHVPRYDPVAVFAPPAGAVVAAGLLSFGVGVAVGSAWRGNYWNWNTGAFFPPVWPGYPGWRGGGNNVTINGGGGNTIIGGGNGGNNVIGGRPWRPDPDRRPGGRPGAGGPIGRPGLGGGIGGSNPPGGGPGGGGPGNRPGPGGGNGVVRPPAGALAAAGRSIVRAVAEAEPSDPRAAALAAGKSTVQAAEARSIVPAAAETEPCDRQSAAGRSIVPVRAVAPSADPAGALAAPSVCLVRAGGPVAAASPDKRGDSRLGRRRAAAPVSRGAEAKVIAGACRAGRLIKASRAAADIIAVAADTIVVEADMGEGAGISEGAGVVNGARRERAR